MQTANGISNRRIADVPLAVLDFETTGIHAGFDRVVEVSVVRIDRDGEPNLVFDTLVNPNRRMGARFVHGITDRDVADAPRFEQIVPQLLRVLSGCVLAAYNAGFDMRFLESELRLAGRQYAFPHLCLMFLRPMLGLGRQCKLPDACWAHGIPMATAHAAADDALASARLWSVYAHDLRERNVSTFGELAAIRRYKFTESFDCDPHPETASAPAALLLKRRSKEPARSIRVRPLAWT
jgi:DNA polymerase III subunit epsilon